MTKFAARIRMNDTTNPVLFSEEVDLKHVRMLRSGRLSGLLTVDTSLTLLTDTVCVVSCVTWAVMVATTKATTPLDM